MRLDIEVQDLPGIGKRYEVHGEHQSRVAVVLHHTGRRDLYTFESDRDADPEADPDAVVEFSDAQARQLGAILGGAYFKPAVVEEIEAVIGELLIEWVTLDEDSPLAGRTISEMAIRKRTGMTVVAVVRGRQAITMPDKDERMQAGDRLVVIGVRKDFEAFQRLLAGILDVE